MVKDGSNSVEGPSENGIAASSASVASTPSPRAGSAEGSTASLPPFPMLKCAISETAPSARAP